MSHFFVSTPLGFEKSALSEMKEAWPFLLGKDAKVHSLPFPEVQIHEGGFEFESDLFVGPQLNFFLKTANRVLLRMASFKTRDLPKFYHKFKSLPWNEYLTSSHVAWEVAAQTSRLNNEKRLQESAQAALQEIFKVEPTGAEPCATIYIRMVDDLCTVSLDSSGEHLHKRGWSVLKGEAPLRETIAAYLLKALIGEATLAELSEVTLLDPMVGSGTFLSEARALYSGQFARPYAFQKWKRAPKLFLSPSFVFNYELSCRQVFKKYVGFDLDEKTLSAAAQNFAEVEKQISVVQKKHFQKASLELRVQDALIGEYEADGPLWLILNPPYGERLPEAVREGLPALADQLCRRYKPNRIGLLYPEKDKVRPVPEGYQVLKEIKISNGGIRCLFTLLTRL